MNHLVKQMNLLLEGVVKQQNLLPGSTMGQRNLLSGGVAEQKNLLGEDMGKRMEKRGLKVLLRSLNSGVLPLRTAVPLLTPPTLMGIIALQEGDADLLKALLPNQDTGSLEALLPDPP